MMAREDLFIVDGHALAYRAYFAFIRNPLINSKGENTSAVFGFTRMLLLLLKKYAPRHLAVVFDSGEETQRHRDFPAYKAHRPEMPDDMASELKWIFEVTEALGIKVIMKSGVEADDLIATLARRANAEGLDATIVTGDKDFFQLLSDHIRIIRPEKGTALEEEIGPEYCAERFGLAPERVVDLLALMGDSSDNIPGVKGIGEKTALKLLQEYGSLDAIYDRIDEVKPAHVRDMLKSGKDGALMSRELVILKDVPVDFLLPSFAIRKPDGRKLTDLLLRLEFHQLLKELSPVEAVEEKNNSYTIVDEESLAALEQEMRGSSEFVFDVETTSVDPMNAEIVGISFCVREGEALYVPVAVESGADGGLFRADAGGRPIALSRIRDVLGPVFADERIGKIGHNIKFDSLVLEAHGFAVGGGAFDTMIASYCLDPERRSHSLDNLALEFARHRKISYAELFEASDRRRDIRTVPIERLARYSCEDADYTMRLKAIFERSLAGLGFEKLFREVEMPLSLVLKRMEQEGVAIDAAKLAPLSEAVTMDLDRLTGEIHRLAGEEFNINSSKQLQRILFEKLGLATARKTKTGYSTDEDVLTELAGGHPIAGKVLEYRQLSKMKSTYIDALPRLVNPRTGRIHTSFNQTVTATGRLSSSDPNLQNIPIRTELGRSIRSAFVPRRGNVLMDADYSQIELRIMAHLSGDSGFVETFREGGDIHTRTAARIFNVSEKDVSASMRASAKTINFGVIYGMGPRGLANQLGIGLVEAKRFIDEYFEKYPGVRAYIEKSIAEARRKRCAETLLGRRRILNEIDSEDNRVRSFSERIAVNMPIQGTAADMIKIAMIRIDRDISDRVLASRMILQVHDELVFEVAPEERASMETLVRCRMESALELDVPVQVDIGFGANWLEAH
ncbi:MAG: DNA polymerase I [Candidatus Krumholzibacteria bacterium]|nr:DNA polymerase I [Candidatus Krumholzibacteria bacterium]